MKGKLFLFQWDSASARLRVKELRAAGWKVTVESEDGARGGNKVKANPPDVVVMDLARRPSHSRETAEGLQSLKATRHIPVVLVDGTEEAIAKTKAKVPNAIYVTSSKLKRVLGRFSRSGEDK